ncbi:MAG: glycosyltransferase [Defluviimonas sp.]|nr:glycosyltransferase [Defluviimonas sp.]
MTRTHTRTHTPTHTGTHADTAAVVIGRNEGARLLACLASLQEAGVAPIVYVDSGSTDGSAEAARARGAAVIALDLSRPFTAARARNAGLDHLSRLPPDQRPGHVQLVDGDCELHPGWIAEARAFLEARPGVAVVCGRRRERFPEATPYNRLCDWEWDTPPGETRACGGDALMRLEALEEVGGYNPGLIAGEEPEMCLRLRQAGWTIWRLDAEMTLHDAAMTRFGQFWKRARRAGHAFAEGAAMHGRPPENHGRAETRRALLWGLVLPVAILVLAVAVSPWALLLVALYPAQVARLARRDGGTRFAWEKAILLTASKFAETAGILEYRWRRLMGRPSGLIEYK